MCEKQDETVMKILKCRTCLQEHSANSDFIDLFQCTLHWNKSIGIKQPLKGIESTLADDLSNLANIQIKATDKYPKVICGSCCRKLQMACDFVAIVRKSDSILRKANIDNNKIIWPKPLQIDMNINKTVYENVMDIEVKQELECMNNNKSDDLAPLEIKMEPEEFIQEHQNIKENQSSNVEITDMHAQCFFYELGTSETNDNAHATKAECDIIFEAKNDQNKSTFKHVVPDRIENRAAAAERSRLYRERHRTEINQRRRENRRHQQKLYQINTASIHDDIKQYSNETSNKNVDSHTRRQRQYYERHREEINLRKRDQRLKQNVPQTVPATAAERNRKYRERKKQEINERRRRIRQCKQNLQEIHAELHTEQIIKATPDHILVHNTFKNITKYY